jgi:outer membrane protein OmpA-like peptidoglycan-associated protein
VSITSGASTSGGRILLLSSPLDAEATVHFSNIELPTLNPYAAELAGYRIDQGMLDLQLKYTLRNGFIQGDNHARINQLVLGPQVRKADAPDLPLRAAIDVLRNADGVIDLDVPIQGNLNDPDIVIRDVVFDALRGVLVRTLESPFTVLANLLGRDTETLRHIGFAGGTAVLTGAAREKLKEIAHALSDHPNLLLFIEPGYYRGADIGGSPPGRSPPGGSPGASSSAAQSPPSAALRALAVRRAETIKAALVKSGTRSDHIYIDEPSSVPALAKDGTVTTTLEAKAP